MQRIFVNAAIKKALCREAKVRSQLAQQRSGHGWGHDYHFHTAHALPGRRQGMLRDRRTRAATTALQAC